MRGEFRTLRALTVSPGPTGFESAAMETAAELLRPLVDEVRFLRLGSVVGIRRCGKPGAKRVLLDAHLDEVGFLITGYDGAYLRFRTLGGIDPRVLPGREVTLLTDPPRIAVVAAPEAPDGDRAIALGDLRLDAGLSEDQSKKLIPPGTPAVYRQNLFRLGPHQIAGKALDDRSCFFALLQTLELLRGQELDVDLYVLGSCDEEIHGTGARTAAYELAPDCAVAVDVTFGETPDGPKVGCSPMGGGPTVAVGPNMSPWMTRRLFRLAEELAIPVDTEVASGNSGTNGWEIQIAREGIATAVVSLPEKYMHTPVEVIHRRDVRQLARLLAAFVTGLGEEMARC